MKPTFFRQHFLPYAFALGLFATGSAMGQVNIDIGSTSGSGSTKFDSTKSFTYNFGVTSAAGSLSMANLRIALGKGNNASAPITIQIYSGLGGTGTLLRTVTVPVTDITGGNNMTFYALSLGSPLSLSQGAYSVRVSTSDSSANGGYSIRPAGLTLTGSNSVTLDTTQWIQDNNTSGTAGNTLTPSQGYVLADHTVSNTSLDLGRFHTGGAAPTATVNYNNVAPATTGNVTESLTVAGSAGGTATVSNVPVTHTVQGGQSSVTVGVTNGTGVRGGNVQLNFNSVITGSSSTRNTGPLSVGSRTISVTATGYSGQSEWTANQNGSWNKNDFARWDATGGTPGLDGAASVADTALFGTAATAARTITLDGNSPVLRSLTFNNTNNGYTIATGTGSANLGLGNATNAGTLTNSAGQHVISANVVLGNRLTYSGVAGTTTTISGGISGSGHGLTKQGAGTLRLTGTNTFNGTTTVEAGTLIVNGSSASATTVNSGATLGGSGTISGATTISGIHSPGNSPGLQNFTGGLTYNANATVVWELIRNSTEGRGGNYDAIDVSGGLTFAGATTLSLDFDFFQELGSQLNSDVNWTDSFWDTSKLGDAGWEIFKVTNGSITGFNNLTLGGSLLDAVSPDLLTSARGTFSLAQVNNSIYLNYTAYDPNANVVPETSSTLLGLLGGGLMLRRRRQKA